MTSNNALRRSALDSDDGGANSAPGTYVVVGTPRRTTIAGHVRRHSLHLSLGPTAPLAVHNETAGTMAATARSHEFRTPENSECSGETSAPNKSLVTSRHKMNSLLTLRTASGDDEIDLSDSRSNSSHSLSSVWSDTSSTSTPPSCASTPPRRSRPLTPIPEEGSVPTYTKICFNPDPLGDVAWQTYYVPDTIISNVTRAFLVAATKSDSLEPLRICECRNTPDRSVCTSHAPPDMACKIVACYLLDAGVASIRQGDLKRLVQAHRSLGHIAEPGIWQAYRARSFNHVRTPVSKTYKFKMFFA